MEQNPTIRDVAKASGVSIGTVSRVLNKHPNVHPRTREKILQTMKSLDYKPVFAAQELSRGNRRTIGFSTGLGTKRLVPFFSLFVEHLMASAASEGYRFLEIRTGADGLPVHFADAMVLFGIHDDDPRIPYLQKHDVPLVLIGRGRGCQSVHSDDIAGGRIAAEHMIHLNHEKILVLTDRQQSQAGRDRLTGIRTALGDVAINLDDDFVIEIESDGNATLNGYRAVRSVLQTDKNFTAIICFSDEIANGAITACEDSALAVPRDVSVIGYDDLPEIGEHITTIRQDIPLIAETAVRLLTAAIAGGETEQLVIPVRLIARRTTSRRAT